MQRANRTKRIYPRMGGTRNWRLALILAVVLLSIPFSPALMTVHAQQSEITSPATGSAVAGDVPVIGTAVIEPFQKYEIHYKLEPSGDDAFIYFDGGTTPVVNGQLAVWRASGLAPGVYSLRLRVVKLDGNYAEFFAQNVSVNQGPVPTPTSDQPTPTPIPTATFTPAAQPTPAVGQVEQPGAVDDAAAADAQNSVSLLPTATPATVAIAETGGEPGAVSDTGEGAAVAEIDNLSRQLGTALSLSRLRGFFVDGMRISAMIFLIVGAVFGARWLFSWARRKYM